MEEFIKETTNLINARFPIIQINTNEETRLINTLNTISKSLNKKREIKVWKCDTGLIHEEGTIIDDTLEKTQLLEYITKDTLPTIYIILDTTHLLHDNGQPDYYTIRQLKTLYTHLKTDKTPKTIILTNNTQDIPTELKQEITITEYPLPNTEQLNTLINTITENNNITKNLTTEEQETLTRAMRGLTFEEAENSISKAIITHKELNKQATNMILEEKKQILQKNNLLEYIPTKHQMKDIGGLDTLKTWLNKRTTMFNTTKRRKYNLPTPKGILLTGIPGCGKSLTAKTIANTWQIPLIKFDISKVYNRYVGNSEENMREAIQVAEAISPCVLWIDEIEKGFSGLGSNGDSGTSTRIFGTFLTWLQDKTSPVFCVATANNINGLPPELLRKGRFDEIFFIDLPNKEEREQILRVHFQKYTNKENTNFRIELILNTLIELTENYTGAEIEQSIINALTEAYVEDRKMNKDDLIQAIKQTIPISKTQQEKIYGIRNWAKNRAITATKKEYNTLV